MCDVLLPKFSLTASRHRTLPALMLPERGPAEPQNIAALARALQAALVDYHDDQLERIREQEQSLIPF